jgi:hypothetical protein
MAVQLTRDPDGLARALLRIGGTGIPDGGEGREYCFIHGPPSHKKGGFADRRTITLSLHPPLGRRLQRLHALGATAGGGERARIIRFELIAQYPGRALVVALLLALLVPLGVVLLLAVGFMTAIALTLGLAAGLAISAGALG